MSVKQYVPQKVMISQAHWYLGESLDIHFYPGILACTLEKQKLTRIFEAEISIGDVFAFTPFLSQVRMELREKFLSLVCSKEYGKE